MKPEANEQTFLFLVWKNADAGEFSSPRAWQIAYLSFGAASDRNRPQPRRVCRIKEQHET